MEVTGKEGVTFFKRGVRFYTMGKVGGGGGWGILKNSVNLSNRRGDFEMMGWYSFTDYGKVGVRLMSELQEL